MNPRDRWGRRLRRAMQACTRWPALLDPLKALWLGLGIALLKFGPLRGWQPALATDSGLRLVGGATDSMLNLIIFIRGVFEPTLSRVIEQVVQEGDVCVDAGANVGYFTLLLARLCGAHGRVISIEAAPRNVRRIHQNLQLNALVGRVQVVEAACTDVTGDVRFYINTRNDMHCRLSLPVRAELEYWLTGGAASWRAVTVRADTLSAMLGDEAALVTFIKLDIEGAEHRVVADLLRVCTHPRLKVALEAKVPYIRATLEPFERAGFRIDDLRNNYRWTMNRDFATPRACSFEQAYAHRFMVDVLLSREPLAAAPAPSATGQ